CPNCKTEGAVTGLDLNCKECGQSFVNRNFFDENEPVGPYSKDDLKNLVEVICPKCKTVNRRDRFYDSDNTHKT
ncbi:MAG: hypothetical protein VYC28_02110, partial [Thermoproteota archaeon]|nr:hypothetical protein [Thermoproteota archaeon]